MRRWWVRAALAPAAVLGGLRGLAWAVDDTLSAGTRLLAAAVELSQWLTLGALVAGALGLGTLVARRFEVTSSRPWLAPFVGLYSMMWAFTASLVAFDLSSFAERQTLVSPTAIRWFGTGLVPLLPMGLAALGFAVRSPWWRWLLAASGVALVALNGAVLPHDYPGTHLVLALCAGSLLSPWLATTVRPPSGWLGALGAFALAAWLAIGTPPTVAAPLANRAEAAAAPVLDRARYAVVRALAQDTAAATLHPEWFRPRAHLPDLPPRRGPVDRPFVIFVSIDALRADVIHSDRYATQLPTFSRLLRTGVSFTQARSPATITKMSMSSLARGTYFSQQRWTNPKADVYSPAEDTTPTFLELLHGAGIPTTNVRTIFWVNSPYLRGFAQQPLAKCAGKGRCYAPVDRAYPILRSLIDEVTDEPAFLFTHLSDPHAPYVGRAKSDKPFDRYLHELKKVDGYLGRLLARIEKRGLMGRTYFIVTADHGEEFGEHGAHTHGTTLYDAALRVPLIISGPGIEARVITTPVTTLDLGPTVLDLFGLPTPAGMIAESLLGVALGEDPAFTRPIAAETRLLRAWITPDNLKLIWDTRSGRVEAYDLRSDPDELRDIYGRHQEIDRAYDELSTFFRVHGYRSGGYEPPYFR
jgi:hypothetical protein